MENKPSTPSDTFRALVAKLVQVPKAAVDKEEAKYQNARKKLPNRGPKPK